MNSLCKKPPKPVPHKTQELVKLSQDDRELLKALKRSPLVRFVHVYKHCVRVRMKELVVLDYQYRPHNIGRLEVTLYADGYATVKNLDRVLISDRRHTCWHHPHVYDGSANLGDRPHEPHDHICWGNSDFIRNSAYKRRYGQFMHGMLEFLSDPNGMNNRQAYWPLKEETNDK